MMNTLSNAQQTDLEALGKRLWKSADDLRANSNFASNQYFFPVMGMIFLRHAYNRFLLVRHELEAKLPSRGGVVRELTKNDFLEQASLYLQPQAQFETLVNLPSSADIGKAINDAMQSIEDDYPELAQTLPRGYDAIDKDLLGRLLRVFNDQELQRATDDVFGRIYEYFLVSFANQAAHDSGEFFTPVSLVQMIVRVLEPERGRIFDPACGSGGMFVQSNRYLESQGKDPRGLVFWGQEKNGDTIKLGKMNLAVHGMSGNISQAISYYGYEQQPLKVGDADYVMANPPFNVDEIDAEKIKNDPRMVFGLPGTNKDNKVPNGNYVWISYFYAYLNAKGRAGFVMSSQTSSAGRDEAKVREQLVKTGHVDAMMAIRGGFFYTRTVPCELWFLDKGKPATRLDTVLMIDARHTNRKVTRTVYDFSPEQMDNLSSIVWLYRQQPERFLGLVSRHLENALSATKPLPALSEQLITAQNAILSTVKTFWDASLFGTDQLPADLSELEQTLEAFATAATTYQTTLEGKQSSLDTRIATKSNQSLHQASESLKPSIEALQALSKQADTLIKLAQRVIEHCEKHLNTKESPNWNNGEVRKQRQTLENSRQDLKTQIDQAKYFFKHALWLQERFPEAKIENVLGMVKVVTRAEIAAADYSLTPGRYVGVAPELEDETFDFTESIRAIHTELADLNTQAQALATKIQSNLEGLV